MRLFFYICLLSISKAFHAEGDAVATVVDLDDAHLDVLMEFHYVERMGNTTIGHLGDVNQSIVIWEI